MNNVLAKLEDPSYERGWVCAAAGPLTELLRREIAHHEIDQKLVHDEARKLLVRVGLDLHPSRARAVLIDALLQWRPEDSDAASYEDLYEEQ